MSTLKRRSGEQARELARRLFGLPMGADPESADVLRYFFTHELHFPNGVLPDDIDEIELPSVPLLFKIYRDRKLGDRPTGNWTVRRRSQRPSNKPKL